MRASLEKIYRRHRQGLYTLALSITRRPSEAEDTVQEAFARLWKSGACPQGDVVAYVFAAVRNVAVEHARHQGARLTGQDLLVSIYDGRAIDPASAAMAGELNRTARQAMDSLPDDQREVVVMRIHGGLKFVQIAEAIGCPFGTVVSRYRRALERLRVQIGAEHGT